MPSWVKKYPNYSGWNDGNKCAKVFKVVVSDSNLLNGDIIEGSTKLEGNGVPQTYADANVSVTGNNTALQNNNSESGNKSTQSWFEQIFDGFKKIGNELFGIDDGGTDGKYDNSIYNRSNSKL